MLRKMKLCKVVAILENFAPLKLAGSWDNVGLLVEPSSHTVKKMLLTNDLTKRVLEEAIETKSDMILSYHPPIFSPLKRLTQSSWKERIVIKCLENKIAVFSPHTSWDAIEGGVNDWLIKPFDKIIQNCEAVEKIDGIDYSTTSTKVGYGRRANLNKSIALKDAIEIVKTHLNMQNVRLAFDNKKTIDDIKINSIGVCAGSGASVLRYAKADLLISGEMSHHEVLNYVAGGSSVILCEHSNTERGFLKHIQAKLSEQLEDSIEVLVSSTDADPLQIV
ncbi:DgyrCDS253 [Dimorphilus gyrociliatus]|uniref:NIF3-like protein 1 n=1 Tax=Dimorphilus gyrociliatus TaxID=2664684 RepID=A0A7I8V6K5_9ANNE|nr:DgyrCDS253 [Dimorphilus gyrociliatus]